MVKKTDLSRRKFISKSTIAATTVVTTASIPNIGAAQGRDNNKEKAEDLFRKSLASSKLQQKSNKSAIVVENFTGKSALSEADKVLLEDQLPLIQGEIVEKNLRLMIVFRDLMTAESVPSSFSDDPVSYVEQATSSRIVNGEVAPGLKLDANTLIEMLDNARSQYDQGRTTLPDEVMAVHTSTSSSSYVTSESRTSFTFEKSNITGTEKRAITSSETRTTTVTSGRGILDVDMSNVLIRPELLDDRLRDFYLQFGEKEPNLRDLLDPGWTDPVRPLD